TRHFVITPRFVDCTTTFSTFCLDKTRTQAEYCIWTDQLFSSFTSVDQQTVLNDDDGTLTGFKATTVVNADAFFLAPVEAVECRSDNTSLTSPYEYLTTVVYPKCLTGGDETCLNWATDCTNPRCSGVGLYRQDLLPKSDKNVAQRIFMMGQNTGQRSNL